MQTDATSTSTSVFRQAHALGLSVRDAIVLEAMGQLIADDAGATVAISLYELSSECGLPVAAIQRSLIALRDAGLIVRRQEEKRSGNVALTAILPKAWAFLGLEPQWQQTQREVPSSIASLCFRQPRSVLMRICDSLATGKTQNLQDLTGDEKSTLTIIEAIRAEIAASGDVELSRLREGERLTLTTVLGEGITIDLALFQNRSPERVHEGFLKNVLERVIRTKTCASKEQIASMLAEAAHTRAYGFVRHHDSERAERVLAKVMSEDRWSRPHKIRMEWYQAATAAVVVREASTGSSNFVH